MEYEVRDKISEPILKTYQYGSRVYGCHSKKSDYDFIAVVKSDEEISYTVDFPNVNFKVYSEPLFIRRIEEHHISVLECIFQSEDDPYVKHFKLNMESLRRSISGISSNSYVKAKKKIKQGDYYIGKKSLFHSLRILGFGVQIALSGTIMDYSSYNHYMDRLNIMTSTDWEVYRRVFESEFKRRKKQIKEFAPLQKELEG